MAKLITPYLFRWEEVEAKSDLERLRLVLDHLPDEELMGKLEKHRKWGRDDYPIRPVWNSVLAGVVYQHQSIDSLRRELSRNGELRGLCGLGLPFVMLAMAVGRIKEEHQELMRSLVKSPIPLDKAA